MDYSLCSSSREPDRLSKAGDFTLGYIKSVRNQ